MALIQCPDCGKEISAQAPSCPNCGRPQDDQPAKSTDEPDKPEMKPPPTTVSTAGESSVVTIQRTSKGQKLSKALAIVTILVGVYFIFTGMSGDDNGDTIIGFVVLVVGIIWLLIGAVLTWWRHH